MKRILPLSFTDWMAKNEPGTTLLPWQKLAIEFILTKPAGSGRRFVVELLYKYFQSIP